MNWQWQLTEANHSSNTWKKLKDWVNWLKMLLKTTPYETIPICDREISIGDSWKINRLTWLVTLGFWSSLLKIHQISVKSTRLSRSINTSTSKQNKTKSCEARTTRTKFIDFIFIELQSQIKCIRICKFRIDSQWHVNARLKGVLKRRMNAICCYCTCLQHTSQSSMNWNTFEIAKPSNRKHYVFNHVLSVWERVCVCEELVIELIKNFEEQFK